MKITEIFEKQKRTFSFEFFPPKDYQTAIKFGINAGQLMKLYPSFVSVTYGASGSTQTNTFELVDLFHNELGFTCMAHYTCVNATKEKIAYDMRVLQDMGIENVMLIRGDSPKGEPLLKPNPCGFDYGSDLVKFVRERYDFCIGAGAYPEKHTEADSLDKDIENLKIKVDAGADFLITQMFFDNNYYWNFLNKVEQKGIKCRIIPGIIPITNFKQIKKFSELTGTHIPEKLMKILEPYQDNPKEASKIGIDHALVQVTDLLNNGARGIHFYTLNKSTAAIKIYESLSQDFKDVKTLYEKSLSPHIAKP